VNLDKNQFHVVTEDFNQTRDGQLDRSPPSVSPKYSQRPFDPLINLNFFDTFRELYPEKFIFTWTNGTTETRIDQIWMSEEAAGLIEASFVADSALITDSDHLIFTTVLNTSELIPNNWSGTQIAAQEHSVDTKRLMINWHDVTKDHLEKLENLIKEKSENRKLDVHLSGLETKAMTYCNGLLATNIKGIPEQQQQAWGTEVDKVWAKISSIILNSCIEGLPHFWISSNPISKEKKKKKRKENSNHTHTAKLIQL